MHKISQNPAKFHRYQLARIFVHPQHQAHTHVLIHVCSKYVFSPGTIQPWWSVTLNVHISYPNDSPQLGSPLCNRLERLSVVILRMDILAIALMFPFRHQGIQLVRGQSGIDLRASKNHLEPLGILLSPMEPWDWEETYSTKRLGPCDPRWIVDFKYDFTSSTICIYIYIFYVYIYIYMCIYIYTRELVHSIKGVAYWRLTATAFWTRTAYDTSLLHCGFWRGVWY